MAQVTDIKEENSESISYNSEITSSDKLSEKTNSAKNDFKKRWDEALSEDEFWGEIQEVIHTHFKNKK